MSDLQRQAGEEFTATVAVTGRDTSGADDAVWVAMFGDHPALDGEEYVCIYQGEPRYGACHEFRGSGYPPAFWFKDFDGHDWQRGETVTLAPN
jgi:hypothetical protein